jgi:hypothetical protein
MAVPWHTTEAMFNLRVIYVYDTSYLYVLGYKMKKTFNINNIFIESHTMLTSSSEVYV